MLASFVGVRYGQLTLVLDHTEKSDGEGEEDGQQDSHQGVEISPPETILGHQL